MNRKSRLEAFRFDCWLNEPLLKPSAGWCLAVDAAEFGHGLHRSWGTWTSTSSGRRSTGCPCASTTSPQMWTEMPGCPASVRVVSDDGISAWAQCRFARDDR